MIIISIVQPDLNINLLKQASRNVLFEVRLDALNEIDFDKIEQWSEKANILWTYRSISEGGLARNSPRRETVIEKLIELQPSYIDLEFARDLSWIHLLQKKSPKTQIFLSYHSNSVMNPQEIQVKLNQMNLYRAYRYKIVATAASSLLALEMLDLMDKNPKSLLIAAGKKGYPSRILNAVYGQRDCFCCLDGTAPSPLFQPTYGQLIEANFKNLSRQTRIFGLVGTDISRSPGTRVYNALFKKNKLDAIYLNFEIKKSELNPFLKLAQKLSFAGLSVTAPFKKDLVNFTLNAAYKDKLFSANTVKILENTLQILNSDGEAAVNLIRLKRGVASSKIVFLGSGGAACAIAEKLKFKENRLIFVNRSVGNAQKLADIFGGQFYSLSDYATIAEDDCDILINSLSDEQFNFNNLNLSKTLIINLSHDCSALEEIAKENQCCYIGNLDFWLYQGAYQYKWWNNINNLDHLDDMKELLFG